MEAVGGYCHSGLLRGGLSAARGQSPPPTRPQAARLGKMS